LFGANSYYYFLGGHACGRNLIRVEEIFALAQRGHEPLPFKGTNFVVRGVSASANRLPGLFRSFLVSTRIDSRLVGIVAPCVELK
jgi:hypothetical protein